MQLWLGGYSKASKIETCEMYIHRFLDRSHHKQVLCRVGKHRVLRNSKLLELKMGKPRYEIKIKVLHVNAGKDFLKLKTSMEMLDILITKPTGLVGKNVCSGFKSGIPRTFARK